MSAATAAWIAIGAAALAVVALALGAAFFVTLRRVRASQLVLLGKGQGDLVDYAVSLQGRIDALHRTLDDVAGALGDLERRVDGTLARTSIVRYDAYANSGGHQSASVALLDATRTGVVLSAIQGRDYARVYVKELDRGKATVALSPEEQEAVDRAMS
ncbi:MAG TPA: DUF4446 family protein [Gaiellaceae bacterium]|nr:DUF4446 family protein [Gaiellaceae bacterium]